MSTILKKLFVFCFVLIQGMGLISFALEPNYGGILNKIVTQDTQTANGEVNISKRFQTRAIDTGGSDELRDILAFIAMKILVPVLTFAGIIVAIIGFYKLFASTSDEDTSNAMKYILWGIVGVVLTMSAGYITNMLVGTNGVGAESILGSIGGGGNTTPSGALVAEKVYTLIFFPFVKLAMYIILGILFIMVVIHAFKYIFSNGEEIQKQSVTILVYNSLGIIIIILAKSMVEAVYGKYHDVINANVKQGGDDIGKIGTGAFNLTNDSFLQLHTVVNRLLGITAFIILILIVYQGYMLLVNPSDEEKLQKLKKSLGYIFLGILVIGAGYLLTNFFIIT